VTSETLKLLHVPSENKAFITTNYYIWLQQKTGHCQYYGNIQVSNNSQLIIAFRHIPKWHFN